MTDSTLEGQELLITQTIGEIAHSFRNEGRITDPGDLSGKASGMIADKVNGLFDALGLGDGSGGGESTVDLFVQSPQERVETALTMRVQEIKDELIEKHGFDEGGANDYILTELTELQEGVEEELSDNPELKDEAPDQEFFSKANPVFIGVSP